MSEAEKHWRSCYPHLLRLKRAFESGKLDEFEFDAD